MRGIAAPAVGRAHSVQTTNKQMCGSQDSGVLATVLFRVQYQYAVTNLCVF